MNGNGPSHRLIDVATHGSAKGIISGLMYLLAGGGSTFLLVSALSAINDERSRGINDITGIMIVMGTISAIVTWLVLATAIRRFRAAFEPNCYFRAGPEGLSFRFPSRVTWSSLLFGYRIVESYLRWNEVAKWYSYDRTINGIPSYNAIVIETVRGGRMEIPLMYFSESREQIVNNISQNSKGTFG